MKLPGLRIAVLVALGCGCGITVAGSLVTDGDAGGVDAGPETGAALPEAGGQPDGMADSGESVIDITPLDASFDANPVNCAAACDGGVCDGGWCTITCTGSQCLNAPVVCPPGVPCAVDCKGQNTCNAGVDCTGATACDIQCSGPGTCINQKVRCTGAACTVKCTGQNTCNQGVDCDAGSCAIGCQGAGSCINDTIRCNSDRCQVVCGTGNGQGQNSCNKGVICTASDSCDITCQDPGTCINQRIIAVAGNTADVRCTGASSCNNGVLTSAGDSGVLCKNTTCGPGIFCDGGACKTRCDGTDIDKCCKATTCTKGMNNCSQMDSCP